MSTLKETAFSRARKRRYKVFEEVTGLKEEERGFFCFCEFGKSIDYRCPDETPIIGETLCEKGGGPPPSEIQALSDNPCAWRNKDGVMVLITLEPHCSRWDPKSEKVKNFIDKVHKEGGTFFLITDRTLWNPGSKRNFVVIAHPDYIKEKDLNLIEETVIKLDDQEVHRHY